MWSFGYVIELCGVNHTNKNRIKVGGTGVKRKVTNNIYDKNSIEWMKEKTNEYRDLNSYVHVLLLVLTQYH